MCVDTMICSEKFLVRRRPDPEGSGLGRCDLYLNAVVVLFTTHLKYEHTTLNSAESQLRQAGSRLIFKLGTSPHPPPHDNSVLTMCNFSNSVACFLYYLSLIFSSYYLLFLLVFSCPRSFSHRFSLFLFL